MLTTPLWMIETTGKLMTEKPKLLLVDDDPLIVESLGFFLQADFELLKAATRAEVRSLLEAGREPPSLALVDLGLPPLPHAAEEGFTLISELLAFNPWMKILVLSGQSDKANIQHALTLGAVDFVSKPCDAELLRTRLHHQLMMLEAESHDVPSDPADCGLLGKSQAITTLRALIGQFADTPFPVLIEGESGVGKELVAQCLHRRSKQREQPYLTLNCAAISADLLESQLFGHARGAFTGAEQARAGFFEEAGEGCLLLDEIGELPLGLQSKLLRVLENGEYYRLGETSPRRSRARIIAATNRDLREAVRDGGFRQDLYHRLSVLTIQVPPLRERDGDCLLLLEHFRDLYATTGAGFRLDPAARQFLSEYAFPGNVRELRNIVIRLGAKYPGVEVGVEALRAELEATVMPAGNQEGEHIDALVESQLGLPGFSLDETLAAWERRYIRLALRLSGGNLSKAARILGVNRTTLYSRMQRLQMDTGSQD